MSKTIVIYGAGAVGCVLAAALEQDDHRVLIQVRPARHAYLAAEGIKIRGKITVNCKPTLFEADKSPEAALFILSVKAYDLTGALLELLPVLTPRSEILLVQNGYGIREAAAEILAKLPFTVKVYQAISAVGATLHSPGEADYFGGGLRLEPDFAASEYAEIWQNTFIKAVISNNFQTDLWRKLVINSVVNPLTALLGLSNHQLAQDKYDRIKTQVLAESLNIAAGAGFAINLQLEDFNRFIDSENISSMLQDFQNGRPTEIDYINGILVTRAAQLQIPAPCNQLLTNLIKVKSTVTGK